MSKKKEFLQSLGECVNFVALYDRFIVVKNNFGSSYLNDSKLKNINEKENKPLVVFVRFSYMGCRFN